jgi:putative FmdB family regulatory protein
MPTYDYVCDGCGHKFEEMQSFKADPMKTCPKCGKDQLRRLFGTGAAILFKGGGFYETDYRSDGYKSAEKADSTAGKPAETTSTTPSTPAPASTPAKSDGPAK